MKNDEVVCLDAQLYAIHKTYIFSQYFKFTQLIKLLNKCYIIFLNAKTNNIDSCLAKLNSFNIFYPTSIVSD